MNFIKRIVNFGISETLSESEKRVIKVFNIIIFAFLILLLLMIVNLNKFIELD